MLPFTREQFLGVFADYNTAVWPAQVVAHVLGLIVVAALLRPSPLGHRVVAGGLAAMWVWTGVAYHGIYFARINPAALVFGALFVVQGVLFLMAGVPGDDWSSGTRRVSCRFWDGRWWPALALQRPDDRAAGSAGSPAPGCA